jgi:DNA-binding NarL/FixJ family response regulator
LSGKRLAGDEEADMSIEAASPTPLTVALVEDDVAFQEAFRTAVAGAPTCRWPASPPRWPRRAPCWNAAVDVLVVDLGLPDGSGVDVIGEAHGAGPPARSWSRPPSPTSGT